MPSRVLCVAGAVSYDYLVYPMPIIDDDLPDEQHENQDLAKLVIRTGSADLVAQLLAAAARQWSFDILSPAPQQLATNSLKPTASSIVNLTYTNGPSQPRSGFTIEQIRNIGTRPVWHSPPIDQATQAGATTVILTGSGDAFQDVEPALDFLQRVKPKYIIHHMTRPLASGRLWDIIRNGPMVRDGVPDPDHLAVIVEADDLRAEGIPLSRSLSWEATAEDFVRNLGRIGRLDTLVTCPNLVVRFGNEGIIHHRGRDAVDPKLYFRPRQMEKTSHHVIGLPAAFTAGFAIGFPDSEKGIRLGMSATQRLLDTGFVENPEDQSPEYPVNTIMNQLTPDKRLSVVNVPSHQISSGIESFSIFNTLTGDPNEVARQIVTLGPDRALARCPVRRFGELRSVEKTEQETLGAMVDTMNERLSSGNSDPTCLGLKGPIGAGKKFAAKNLSDQVGETWPVRRLTYNTRVVKPEDITHACHTIRDNTAENYLTVVSFENFESVFDTGNLLHDEFASLMRYGLFKDGNHERRAGRCLLLFLVNEAPPPDENAKTPATTEFPQLGKAGEPVLLDNLHGMVKLMGPNQTGDDDKLFPIRRALMIRQLLNERHPQLNVNGTIKIDEAVLHALVLVPKYNHGLRSLEKIISTSRLSNRTKFDVSALPPEEQIQLHVDGPQFMSYLRSPKLPPALRERLAEGLFEAYKKQRELMATTEERRQELRNDRAMVDWEDLPLELKESTRSQADDIPRKLRVVRCFMLPEKRSDPFIHVAGFTEEELDRLSEMEHERFNAERLQRQWRMGPRNSKQRTTPFLVPWRDLTQEWKDVDRVMVECVPKVLAAAGYYIYRMKESEQ